jgi:hypothetical protein
MGLQVMLSAVAGIRFQNITEITHANNGGFFNYTKATLTECDDDQAFPH